MRTAETPLIKLDTPRFGYQPALDGVRGLGVFIVMFYHFGGDLWLHGAPIMVDIFFVLSAFLITNLLLDEMHREQAISLRGFYTRRILRLFPAMYALLGFVSIVAIIATLAGSDALQGIWVEILAIGTYMYNMLLAFGGFEGSTGDTRYLLHLWTLSMEEWFYVCWPLALIWGLRRTKNQRPLLLAACGFVVFWMAVRLTGHEQIANVAGNQLGGDSGIPYARQVVLRLSVMRPDSLVIGCLSAIASRALFPLTERTRRLVTIGGVLSACVLAAELVLAGRVAGFEPFGSPGYNLAIVMLGPGVVWMHYSPDALVCKELSRSFWVFAGKRSYGIYIWHPMPNAVLGEFGPGRIAMLARMAVLMVISFGIAELSWRFIESPFLRRKHALFGATKSGR